MLAKSTSMWCGQCHLYKQLKVRHLIMQAVVDDKGIPILGLDVWEHAYYLKYESSHAYMHMYMATVVMGITAIVSCMRYRTEQHVTWVAALVMCACHIGGQVPQSEAGVHLCMVERRKLGTGQCQLRCGQKGSSAGLSRL